MWWKFGFDVKIFKDKIRKSDAQTYLMFPLLLLLFLFYFLFLDELPLFFPFFYKNECCFFNFFKNC